MAIEKYFKEYAFSDEEAKFRYMNIGQHTIDVKEFQCFLTNDPNN